MNNLVKFRTGLNKSTSEMASIIGVSKSYYEKIEYGDRNPSYNFITKFKNSFPDIDIDDFFFLLNDRAQCTDGQ